MNCAEVRALLFAFLDNELDAAKSIDVQQHLEQCAVCAQDAEIERLVRRQLANSLADPIGASAFRLPAEITGPRIRSLRPAWRGVVAACVILLPLIGYGIWRASGPSDDAPKSFLELVVADFEHFLSEDRKVKLASADTNEVSQWLESNTGIRLDIVSHGDCRLLGARSCSLAGSPAAFAAYEMSGVPASLVAVNPDAFDFRAMRAVDDDADCLSGERRGVHVVACRRGDKIIAAVGRLSVSQLEHLIPEVAHATD